MKKLGTIVIIIAVAAVIYLVIDTLFDLFTDREIIVGLLSIVTAIMLYFSLKPCFTKNK